MEFQCWTEHTVYPRASRPVVADGEKAVLEVVKKLLADLEPQERIIIEPQPQPESDQD